MSYQQYVQSALNARPDRSQSPVPGYTIQRKPPANYSPMPKTPTSTHKSLAEPSLRTASLSSSAAPATSSPREPATPSSAFSPTPATFFKSDIATLTQAEVDVALASCLTVLTDAITHHGKRPFSALLLAPDNKTVLLTHNSLSHVQHAESELARLAALQFSKIYLAGCTLVSTWEPCAMCAGTIYWSGIGRVLYAASEKKLKELTGPGNEENLTLDLPCRSVLNAGQRQIEVIGPISTWEEQVMAKSRKWWQEHNSNHNENAARGTTNTKGLINSNNITIVSQDNILGTVGDDGEYQADLKVDWMI